MAANVYLRSFTLNALEWVPLAEAPLVLTVTLIASSQNEFPFYVRGPDQVESQWPPGAAAVLEGVDLSEIEVLGDAGQLLLVVAYSR